MISFGDLVDLLRGSCVEHGMPNFGSLSSESFKVKKVAGGWLLETQESGLKLCALGRSVGNAYDHLQNLCSLGWIHETTRTAHVGSILPLVEAVTRVHGSPESNTNYKEVV